MLFSGSLESGRHTLVAGFLELSDVAFQLGLLSGKRRQVVSEKLSHHRIQCTIGRKRGRIIEDEMGLICG